jgi:hypothetical protein
LTVVLVVLAVVWAVVLIPPWLRNRAEGRPGDSIGAFHRQLSTLERTGPDGTPRPARVPRVTAARYAGRPATPRTRAQKRRRDVMLVLGVVMLATLALSFVPGLGVLLVLHVIADILFVVYVALLVRFRGLAAEREMKLRFLPGSQQVEPALALRRSAN